MVNKSDKEVMTLVMGQLRKKLEILLLIILHQYFEKHFAKPLQNPK